MILSCLINWHQHQVRARASQYLVVPDAGSWMLVLVDGELAGTLVSDDRAIPRRRPGNRITQLLHTLIRSKETVPKRHGLEETSVQGATSGEVGLAESCVRECRPATGDSAGEAALRPTQVTDDSGHRGNGVTAHPGYRRLGPPGEA